MDLSWIWHTVLIFIVGKMVLRIGGRKSISQMTITQTIVMIGIGSLLIQPIAGKGLLVTFLAALLIVLLMVLSEYLEVKFDAFESFSSGKAILVIENGKPIIRNIRKLRLTIDRLETRLRQSGISSMEDVQHATIEVSGQLGYELMEFKKPLTKEDFLTLMSDPNQLKQEVAAMNALKSTKGAKSRNNIFREINKKRYEGNKKEP